MTRTVRSVLLALLLVPAVVLPGQEGPSASRGWEWRFIAGGPTVGVGAFSASGRYYFVSEDRYLYAIDPRGAMIWRTDLGRRPGAGVVVAADGSILVTLDNGELLSLNRDGRLIWRERVSVDRTYAPVVLSSGLVVTVNRPGTLEARTHFGRKIWSVDLQSPVSAAPILAADGNLLVSTTRGELVLISIDGRLLRRRYVGEIGSVLAAATGGSLLGSTDGRLIAVDADLEPIWRADLGSAVHGVYASTTGDLYATSDDGSLFRITSDGELAWRMQPGSRVRTVVVGDGLLHLEPASSGNAGTLSRIGKNGAAQWQIHLPGRPMSLAMAPYGVAIVTTSAWVTYAYRVDFEVAGPWPEDRGASDRRGVASGADTGRVDMQAFSRSAEYLSLRGQLIAGGQSEQVVAMSGLASRVEAGENLAGRHQYMLQLCELVAGSPYFGQLSQFGPESAPRRAREDAVRALGQIGDLRTSRFLARLLEQELDTAMQATILDSMASLGTPVDEELSARLEQIVRRDVSRGPSDRLARSIADFVGAINQYQGGYLHPDVTDVLLAIAGANYSRQVREYALSTLRTLAGGTSP